MELSDDARLRYPSALLRHRPGYYADPASFSKMIRDRPLVDDSAFLDYVLSRAALSDEVRFDAAAKLSPDAAQSLMITLTINGAALEWLPQYDEDRISAIKLVFGWFLKNGRLVNYEVRELTIKRAKARWEKSPDDPVVLPLKIIALPEVDRIRLVVRDTQARRMGIQELRREVAGKDPLW